MHLVPVSPPRNLPAPASLACRLLQWPRGAAAASPDRSTRSTNRRGADDSHEASFVPCCAPIGDGGGRIWGTGQGREKVSAPPPPIRLSGPASDCRAPGAPSAAQCARPRREAARRMPGVLQASSTTAWLGRICWPCCCPSVPIQADACADMQIQPIGTYTEYIASA